LRTAWRSVRKIDSLSGDIVFIKACFPAAGGAGRRTRPIASGFFHLEIGLKMRLTIPPQGVTKTCIATDGFPFVAHLLISTHNHF
jgi:hypothetical protein